MTTKTAKKNKHKFTNKQEIKNKYNEEHTF